jgi:ATP-dependent Clp protease protease subunit
MTIEKDLTQFETHGQALNENGILVLMDDINSDSIKPVVEWILHENFVRKKKCKELLLMICSNGGEISEAFALIDVMNASKIPIKTVGLGQIASCGLLIFLAGLKGRRCLTPNTSILSHQYSWGSEGKHHELWAITKEFGLAQQRMVRHYVETTGLTEKVIREKLLPPNDVYLSADEALKLGICDYVSDLKK